jgi:hypothetical protein
MFVSRMGRQTRDQLSAEPFFTVRVDTHTALIPRNRYLADHGETPFFCGLFAPPHVGITVALLVSGRVVCNDVHEG